MTLTRIRVPGWKIKYRLVLLFGTIELLEELSLERTGTDVIIDNKTMIDT